MQKATRWRTLRVFLVLSFALPLPCPAKQKRQAAASKFQSQTTTVQSEKATLPSPDFSVPSGVYTNDFLLKLSTGTPSLVIRYTLDGSEPGDKSKTYSEPIRITTSTLIKAKAFGPGSAISATISHTYTILDESLLNFNSNLPLVILNTFEGYVSSETPTPISARFIHRPGARNFLTGAADFDARGTLKTRGRSSLEYPKRSFVFHTRDENENPLKTPLLGLPKDSDWILYAPYPDKTLMRDALAYELSNQMGHYAPRTRFVELFVNRTGNKLSNRSYMGVYVLVEKIKRGAERVNIQKLTPQDNAEPAISGGYIFKKDHADKDQPRFGTARGNHFYFVEPKPEEITPAQRSWLVRYLSEFERALYSSNFKDPQRGYPAYIDTDSFIDHHWIVEMSKNVDGIRFSNFLHKDRNGKIKMDPIWDWNLSFGNASGKQGWNPEGWYWPQLDDYEYLWFGRLFEDPDFMQKYIDRWAALRTNVFSTARILSRVDEIAALLGEAQVRNFQRWRIMGRYVHPNRFVGSSYQEEVQWMKNWIQSRLAWIDSQFPSAPVLSARPGAALSGDSVSMNVRTGKIYYTLDQSDPRMPGGAVSPAARLYTKPFAIKEKTQIVARTYAGNTWSSPVRASFVVAASAGPMPPIPSAVKHK